jgi:hypothetical protein
VSLPCDPENNYEACQLTSEYCLCPMFYQFLKRREDLNGLASKDEKKYAYSMLKSIIQTFN